jgi:oxygen-independent coproporphyrinogen-3 oxidase
MNLGVYVQVPFCQTKCTYCNFHTGAFSPTLYAPYVNAVIREIETAAAARSAEDWLVDTVYIGGGTPSLLHPVHLADLMATIRRGFRCALEEVTLEADPETLTPEKAAAWRTAGIGRISMGAQSFHDGELRAAGRMHRRADIFAAADILREAGFRNISLDLIAGLPHQTHPTWQESLECLLRIRPEHVSIYMMEIDEGSNLGREALAGGSRYGAGALPEDDAVADFYEQGCVLLERAGYDHYEISNWALGMGGGCVKPSPLRSRHNLKYWRRQPYFGFGAGAHSFDGRTRWSNRHDPREYAAAMERGQSPQDSCEAVGAKQALEEELFLGLRQLDGVDMDRIEAQYSVSLGPRLAALRDAGLLEISGSHARLARDRIAISNEVFTALLE